MTHDVGDFRRYQTILAVSAQTAIDVNPDLVLAGWKIVREDTDAGLLVTNNTDPPKLFAFTIPLALWKANVQLTTPWMPLFLRAVSQYAVFSLINYVIQRHLKEVQATADATCQAALDLTKARLSLDGSAARDVLMPRPARLQYINDTNVILRALSKTVGAVVTFDATQDILTIAVKGAVHTVRMENISTDPDFSIVNSNIVAAIWAVAVPATEIDGVRLLTELNALVGAYTTGIGKPQVGKIPTKIAGPPPVACEAKAMIPRGGDANSCYFNATLVAMLHNDNAFLTQHLLTPVLLPTDVHGVAIRDELNVYKTALHAGTRFTTIDTMRNLFQAYQATTRAVFNWINAQQAPQDVVQLLIDVFDVPAMTVVTTEELYSMDDPAIPDLNKVWFLNTSTDHNHDIFYIVFRDVASLAAQNPRPGGEILMEDLIDLRYYEATQYNQRNVPGAGALHPLGLNRKQTHVRVVSAPYLIVSVERRHNDVD